VFGGDTIPEPRRRRGGIGKPRHERLAYYPSFRCGIPDDWTGAKLDPRDPPLYEAQATYLERNGLLVPGEREMLTTKDFKPEAVKGLASIPSDA
jgi:hypothetical protein